MQRSEVPTLSFQATAFLMVRLSRVKRVFQRRKKQKNTESSSSRRLTCAGDQTTVLSESGQLHLQSPAASRDHRPAPLTRSRTLPLILVESAAGDSGVAGETEATRLLLELPQCGDQPPHASSLKAASWIYIPGVGNRQFMSASVSSSSGGSGPVGGTTTSCVEVMVDSAPSPVLPPPLPVFARSLSSHLTSPLPPPPPSLRLSASGGSSACTVVPPGGLVDGVGKRNRHQSRRSSSVERLSLSTEPAAPPAVTSSSCNKTTKPTQLLLAPPTISSGAGGSCKLLDLSPSIRRRIYKEKNVCPGSMEILVDGLNMTKSEKKRLTKMKKLDIHLHALYAAVEHNQLDRVRTILKTSPVDVNSVNADGFSLLDVAVLTGSAAMSRLLLSCGATQSNQFGSKQDRCARLYELLLKSQRRVDTLSQTVGGAVGGVTGGATTPATSNVKQCARQLALWQRRAALFNKMARIFNEMSVPEAPAGLNMEVSGSSSVRVLFSSSSSQTNVVTDATIHRICTKYKVQWSRCADFAAVEGDIVVAEKLPARPLLLRHLHGGQRYYVRAAAGNLAGWSSFRPVPPFSGALPSLWSDGGAPCAAERRVSRDDVPTLDRLFGEVRGSRPHYASTLPSLDSGSDVDAASGSGGAASGGATSAGRATKKSIMQLFQPAVRFHKHLKQGVYLATVLYYEDRVALTTEDCLPIVEVDDTYPSCLQADLHWLMKVSCTWSDVSSLRRDMERCRHSSAVLFRIKLLTAAEHMQSALGIQNLGLLYYRPLRDSSGTLLLVTINHVRCSKLPTSSARWQSMQRLQRKMSTCVPVESSECSGDTGTSLLSSTLSTLATTTTTTTTTMATISSTSLSALSPGLSCASLTIPSGNSSSSSSTAVAEQLRVHLKQMITYHMVSTLPVPAGLYLAYLHCRSSVDQMLVAAAPHQPNLPPHVRVRDNAHVCREEWEYIRQSWQYTAEAGAPSISDDQTSESKSTGDSNTIGSRFHSQLLQAVQRLLQMMNIGVQHASTHRVYGGEVLELSAGVSVLLLVPACDQVCAVIGTDPPPPSSTTSSITACVDVDTATCTDDVTPSSSVDCEQCVVTSGSVVEPPLLYLPIQTFELVHQMAYQRRFVARYTRLSSILETDTLMAQHALREAFSDSEIQLARDRVSQLANIQAQLDCLWKRRRWLVDIVAWSRDRSQTGFRIPPISAQLNCKIMESSTAPHQHITVGLGGRHLRRHTHSEAAVSCSTATLHPSSSRLEFKRSISQRLLKTRSELLTADSSEQLVGGGSCSSAGGGVGARYNRGLLAFFCGASSAGELYATAGSRTLPALTLDDSSSDESVCRAATSLASPLLRRATTSGTTAGDVAAVRRAGQGDLLSVSDGGGCVADRGPVDLRKSSAPEVLVHVEEAVTTSTSLPPAGGQKTALSVSTPSFHVTAPATPEDEHKQLRGGAATSTTAHVTRPRAPSDDVTTPTHQPGVLQVYAAYETGLASGTSVRLHVTARTSARHVVELVVRQLHVAAAARRGCEGGQSPQPRHFCLVAVIGARERCLRDDFRPLQLQNPWSRGKLFVRRRSDVLAALQLAAGD